MIQPTLFVRCARVDLRLRVTCELARTSTSGFGSCWEQVSDRAGHIEGVFGRTSAGTDPNRLLNKNIKMLLFCYVNMRLINRHSEQGHNARDNIVEEFLEQGLLDEEPDLENGQDAPGPTPGVAVAATAAAAAPGPRERC